MSHFRCLWLKHWSFTATNNKLWFKFQHCLELVLKLFRSSVDIHTNVWVGRSKKLQHFSSPKVQCFSRCFLLVTDDRWKEIREIYTSSVDIAWVIAGSSSSSSSWSSLACLTMIRAESSSSNKRTTNNTKKKGTKNKWCSVVGGKPTNHHRLRCYSFLSPPDSWSRSAGSSSGKKKEKQNRISRQHKNNKNETTKHNRWEKTWWESGGRNIINFVL